MLELYELLLETTKKRVQEEQKSGTITPQTIELIESLRGLHYYAAEESKVVEEKEEKKASRFVPLVPMNGKFTIRHNGEDVCGCLFASTRCLFDLLETFGCKERVEVTIFKESQSADNAENE